MAITEEQYLQITDELDSHDFFLLGDLASMASNTGLLQELDKLHGLSKRALDYQFDANSHESLETFLDEITDIQHHVSNALEALEKIDEVLLKAENVLSEPLYADEFDDD